MASLNVAEWTPDQVADWLAGLGPTVASYIPELRRQQLDGAKLLTLRCDDLEYLGMHIIGHQELLLEAVEHLRNFQYEARRECVQQLALRVSAVATALARALRLQPDARLDTQALADVARTVRAVKPLVCWLDRWPGPALAERKAALLTLALEAATCAQRDRFAEQPARAVAAAAASAAATADYIIQDVCDPMILQPASLDAVTLRQGEKPLGFDVVPSFCGHHQLADIRFGSPAHASGAVHDGDEIVQVGGRCVIGWSGAAVLSLCGGTARALRELPLRLRRRAARPAPLAAPRLLRLRAIHRYEPSPLREAPPARAAAPPESAASSDSELSPPASPTHHLSITRLYPPPPRAAPQRRHSISGGSPVAKRPSLTIEQFWQQLRDQRWDRGAGSAAASPEPDAGFYRRDKALSCSTGLELSPRPRTCLGVLAPPPPPGGSAPPPGPPPPGPPPPVPATPRGRLDKSHSTPAYDFGGAREPPQLAAQPIPEAAGSPADSPTILVHSAEKADQILDFKKSSSAIGEAILQQQRSRTGDERTEFPFGDGINTTSTTSVVGSSTLGSNTLGSSTLGSSTLGSSTLGSSTLGSSTLGSSTLGSSTLGSSTLGSSTLGSSTLGSAGDRERVLETINIAMMEHRRRSVHELGDDKLSLRPQRAPPPPPRPAATLRAAPPPAAAPAAPAPAAPASPAPYPPLRAVPRVPPPAPPTDYSPLKRHIDANQISLPLRHITKHEIKLVPSERRELPAINLEPDPPATPGTPAAPAAPGPPQPPARRDGDVVLSPAHTPSSNKSLFPTSKSRSLKKKSSILAKRRQVPARALAGRCAARGGVWQRVRARAAAAPRWARRHLLLAHNLLYAYRAPDCNRADCMIYLEGFTVCAAGEVKSREHAFKVYHTGTAFYFACDSRDAMLTWIQLIHRATLLPPLLTHTSQTDISKQFSETDYSETESDPESCSRRAERDKSRFGSLKKLPEPALAATSLDRKYLRFFSRHKPKDEAKPAKASKQPGVPVPTEHYRSYRRVERGPEHAPRAQHEPERANIPAPINYIHASNPNLLDFEKSDFVTKPALQAPKQKAHKPENLIGFVTLEEFMLKKQEEERRQVYTNRVLMGVERDRGQEREREREREREGREGKKAAKELQKRLDRIVPDVIYGELPHAEQQHALASRPLPDIQAQTAAPAGERSPRPDSKPISVRGADGYEKLVYPEEAGGWLRRHGRVHSAAPARPAPPAGWPAPHQPAVSRLRLMFARAPQQSGAGGERRGPSSPRPQYPHLQCPPTFQPETYSLAARLAPRDSPRDS